MRGNIGLADIELLQQGRKEFARMKGVLVFHWGQPPRLSSPSEARLVSSSPGFDHVSLASFCSPGPAGGGCLHRCPRVGIREFRQVLPEEFAAVDHLSAAHVEQIDGQHAIFVVIAEHVGIVAFGGGHALPFLQLLHSRNQIAIPRRAFVLLRSGRLFHAGVQRTAQVRGPAFQKQFHVAHGFLVSSGVVKSCTHGPRQRLM